MNSLQDSAWLAGLLDGEGTFCRPASPIVKLEMKDLDLIERAVGIMPTDGKINRRVRPSRPNAKPIWEVTWCGVRARSLMQRIYPYMGVRRKQKISELLRT